MTNGIINGRELRVIGMSRSGNHAIIGWIFEQAQAMRSAVEGGPARLCWLNCTEPRYNPYWTARLFDDGSPHRVNYQPFDLQAEKARRFTRKDWLIYNHEDTYLRVACSPEAEDHHDTWVGPSAERRDILILRDPFNLFASRLRTLEPVVSDAVAVKIWKQHARQFLGKLKFLRHDPVLISYNRWCDDAAYRRRIAVSLGLAFTDAGKDRVQAVHGGSSFDGLRYDGRAGQMRVHDRWRGYIHDPAYRDLFDDQMLRLAHRIFGDLPAIHALRLSVRRAGQSAGAA